MDKIILKDGSSLVMLSSTSLLHGNCVFNRNNTVATQQGMKTYWLCKSYRISMCRARCITHQGRVISATGVHNHTPHMRNTNNNSTNVVPTQISSPPTTTFENIQLTSTSTTSHTYNNNSVKNGSLIQSENHANMRPNQHNANMFSNTSLTSPTSSEHHHHLAASMPNLLIQHHQQNTHNHQHQSIHNQHNVSQAISAQNSVIQNILQQPHVTPMLPPTEQSAQSPSLNDGLQITPLTNHHLQRQRHLQSPIISKSPNAVIIESDTNVTPTSAVHLNENGSLHIDTISDEHGLIVSNANISPHEEINTNTVVSADVSLASHNKTIATARTSNEINARQQAHVDSITMSPRTAHNFKIEDI